MAIDFAPDLHQATRSKKLDRTRPDHIRPTALGPALPQFSPEFFVQHISETFPLIVSVLSSPNFELFSAFLPI
jgi:hypothetical protein